MQQPDGAAFGGGPLPPLRVVAPPQASRRRPPHASYESAAARISWGDQLSAVEEGNRSCDSVDSYSVMTPRSTPRSLSRSSTPRHPRRAPPGGLAAWARRAGAWIAVMAAALTGPDRDAGSRLVAAERARAAQTRAALFLLAILAVLAVLGGAVLIGGILLALPAVSLPARAAPGAATAAAPSWAGTVTPVSVHVHDRLDRSTPQLHGPSLGARAFATGLNKMSSAQGWQGLPSLVPWLASMLAAARGRGAPRSDPASTGSQTLQPAVPLRDAPAHWAPSQAVGLLRVPRHNPASRLRLSEVSGLAASRRSPGLLWAVEDSEAGASIVALNASSGEAIGRLWLADVEATDWEDISAGPCGPPVPSLQSLSARADMSGRSGGSVAAAHGFVYNAALDADAAARAQAAAASADPLAGQHCLWVADTGNNCACSGAATLLRVYEPDLSRHLQLVRAAQAGGASAAPSADSAAGKGIIADGDRASSSAQNARSHLDRPAPWFELEVHATPFPLRYADGPRDADALVMSPTGRPYVFAKSADGAADIYSTAPIDSDDSDTVAFQPLRPHAITTLVRVGHLPWLPGSPRGPRGAVSAADVWPDGSRLLLRTHAAAYELDLRAEPATPATAMAAATRKGWRSVLPTQWKSPVPAADIEAAAVQPESSQQSSPQAASPQRLPVERASDAPLRLLSQLIDEPKGEAIAYDALAGRIWHASEGSQRPLYFLSRLEGPAPGSAGGNAFGPWPATGDSTGNEQPPALLPPGPGLAPPRVAAAAGGRLVYGDGLMAGWTARLGSSAAASVDADPAAAGVPSVARFGHRAMRLSYGRQRASPHGDGADEERSSSSIDRNSLASRADGTLELSSERPFGDMAGVRLWLQAALTANHDGAPRYQRSERRASLPLRRGGEGETTPRPRTDSHGAAGKIDATWRPQPLGSAGVQPADSPLWTLRLTVADRMSGRVCEIPPSSMLLGAEEEETSEIDANKAKTLVVSPLGRWRQLKAALPVACAPRAAAAGASPNGDRDTCGCAFPRPEDGPAEQTAAGASAARNGAPAASISPAWDQLTLELLPVPRGGGGGQTASATVSEASPDQRVQDALRAEQLRRVAVEATSTDAGADSWWPEEGDRDTYTGVGKPAPEPHGAVSLGGPRPRASAFASDGKYGDGATAAAERGPGAAAAAVDMYVDDVELVNRW